MASRAEWQSRRARLEIGPGRSSAIGPRPHPLLPRILRVAAALTNATGLARLGARNLRNVQLREIDLSCPGLPRPLDGFTILHISDPHLELGPELAHIASACLAGIKTDIAVITGDFQSEGDSDPERAAAHILPLIESLDTRSGIYGILGNHDSYRVVAPLERVGVNMLINEHATVGAGEAALHIVGLDDVHAFYTEQAETALTAAPAGFRVALIHTPELAHVAAAAGYGLYLAGHTHGGQICLPGGRPVLTGLDTNRHLASGQWRIGAMHGYTNRGLGTGTVRFRINCLPEMALLRLRAHPG